LRETNPNDKIDIPKINREVVVQYIALQCLRMPILAKVYRHWSRGLKSHPIRRWDEQRRYPYVNVMVIELVKPLTEQIRWLKAGVLSPDTYVPFPFQ
jgi:hypothetical protein